jgi:hypothetical protein
MQVMFYYYSLVFVVVVDIVSVTSVMRRTLSVIVLLAHTDFGTIFQEGAISRTYDFFTSKVLCIFM